MKYECKKYRDIIRLDKFTCVTYYKNRDTLWINMSIPISRVGIKK